MKQTAQGLAALGRGPDTMLVHMAPSEVAGLQTLAKKHGGSLTINPDTGLPEAGFLSSILPTLVGAGLSFIPGVGPLMASGIVGGLQAARTGSISKGLMAGLGAYGGAGMAGGLTAAGAATGAGAAGAGTPEILGGIGTQPATFSGNLAQAGQGFTALPTSEAARTAFMGNSALNGSGVGGATGLMKYGLAAAAPMMMETTTKQPEIKTDASMGQRYSYLPGTVNPMAQPDVPEYGQQGQNFGREQTYFNPQYEKLGTKEARSIYGYADGGPVEAMSNANALGASTGFPQSDIRTGAYSNPFQQPMGQNVVVGAQDVAIDPYTGQEQRTTPAPQAQFADGGSVGSYTYDPVSQTYSKAGGQGVTTVKPVGLDSAAGGSGGGDLPAGYDSLKNASSMNSSIAGFLGDMGLNSLSDAMAAANGPNYSNEGRGAPSSDGVAASGHSSSFDGSSVSDTGNIAGGGGAESEARGGLNLDGKYYPPKYAHGGMTQYAMGGISNLGSYSDGGRLLRGPGDGVSDDIPAMIGKKQPARLADGEFVVPARIVSELGNGSTEAGARKLYAMMERVQKARGKTVGKNKVATNSRAAKHLPA